MAKGELNPSIADDYVTFSATGNLAASPRTIIGIWVAATTSGTLAMYDSATTTTGDQIIATTTFASIGFYPLPTKVTYGVYAVVGGTLSATLLYANP